MLRVYENARCKHPFEKYCREDWGNAWLILVEYPVKVLAESEISHFLVVVGITRRVFRRVIPVNQLLNREFAWYPLGIIFSIPPFQYGKDMEFSHFAYPVLLTIL